MVSYIQVAAIILAGVAVAVADAFIKKVAVSGSFLTALKSPWMIAIILLYFAQIAFFVYVFQRNWDLSVVGNLTMVFYSITILISGLFVFGETLTHLQFFGIGLALVGVILMNV